MKATARPSPSAITHALVPYPPRAHRANGPAPHAHRAPCCWPPFFRARRLLVSPDAGAIENRHPELNPTLLGQEQQAFPHAQASPADEGLRRPRPGPQVSRDGAPLGPVLMPPEDGRDCTTQILGRGLALGPARLDQRLQSHPVRVHEHRLLLIQKGQNAIPVRRFKVEQALVFCARSLYLPDFVDRGVSLSNQGVSDVLAMLVDDWLDLGSHPHHLFRRDLVEQHALGLELGQRSGAHLTADVALIVARLLAGVLQDLLLVAAELIPELLPDQDDDGPVDVTGGAEILLNLVDLAGQNG